jgi:RNA polymerase sigma-70 factor (ECF subfamily)
MVKDEKDLLDQFGEGDRHAFSALVDLYKKKVYFLAYDMVRNHHEAEDISQDVFLRAYKSAHTFRRDAKMSSWLYRITVNASIDRLRKNKIAFDELNEEICQNSFFTASAPTNPESEAETNIIARHIERALGRITPRERAVFVMRHYNNLDVNEIAEIMTISTGTVKSLFFRALKKLQKELSFYRGKRPLEVKSE